MRASHMLRDIVVASAGTDGTDGPTDPDGAVVDGRTMYKRASHIQLIQCIGTE